MKRIVSTIIAIMTIVLAVSASAETMYVMCTPGEVVNVREKPSTSSDILGRFFVGDSFETDGETRKDTRGRAWLHIINASLEMDEAWICKTYTTQYEVDATRREGTIVAPGRVAVRATANGKRKAWIQPDETVTVLCHTFDWTLTTKGYISSEYIVLGGVIE